MPLPNPKMRITENEGFTEFKGGQPKITIVYILNIKFTIVSEISNSQTANHEQDSKCL